ncbi:MAG: hypothetical protein R2911_45965 [Caldilineaceae bacterium]
MATACARMEDPALLQLLKERQIPHKDAKSTVTRCLHVRIGWPNIPFHTWI